MSQLSSKPSVKRLRGFKRSRGGLVHGQVAAYLRDVIVKDFADGDVFFTERAIIEAVGVSQPTVRQALLTLSREGLLDRQVGRGSFVRKNSFAFTLAIIVPDFCSPNSMRVLEAFGGACREKSAHLQIHHTNQEESIEATCRRVCEMNGIKGSVLLGHSMEANRKAREVLGVCNISTIVIGWQPPDDPGGSMGIDNGQAAQMALDHLISCGHQNILVLINESIELGSIRRRVEALRYEAASRHDLNIRFHNCQTALWSDSLEAGYRGMKEALNPHPVETAVLAISDAGGLGALQYLREQGVAVPDHMAVMGFDDYPVSALTHPSLSSIAHPFAAMARSALDWLTDETSTEGQLLFAPSLSARESTRGRDIGMGSNGMGNIPEMTCIS
jgi:DNA-binding LacI/PurR family transcriptional regulator